MDPNKNAFSSLGAGPGGNSNQNRNAPIMSTPDMATPVLPGMEETAPKAKPVAKTTMQVENGVSSAQPSVTNSGASTTEIANSAPSVTINPVATVRARSFNSVRPNVASMMASQGVSSMATAPNMAATQSVPATTRPNTPIMSAPDAEDAPTPRGGIVLGGGKRGGGFGGLKNQKTFIIIGIILVVVATILAVAAAIINSRSSSSGNSSIAEAEAAFNQYANYVYYGEADASSFTFPSDSDFTPFIETIAGQENEDKLLNDLNNYYNGYYNAYRKMIGNNAEIPASVQEYDQAFRFYMVWVKNELPNRDELAVKYVKNGKVSVENELKTLTEKYSSFTDIFGYKYYELMTNWSSSTIELIGKYSEAGCVRESGVDYDCIVEAYGSSLNALDMRISSNATSMRLVQNDAVFGLSFNLILLEEQITGRG